MENAYILIVEDHENVKDSLIQTLQPHFDRVEGITNPNLLVSSIDTDAPDVILLDMNFSAGIHSGNEGLYWLKEVKMRSHAIEKSVLTLNISVTCRMPGKLRWLPFLR